MYFICLIITLTTCLHSSHLRGVMARLNLVLPGITGEEEEGPGEVKIDRER